MSIESHRRRRSSLFQRVAVPAPAPAPASATLLEPPVQPLATRPVTAPQARVTLPFVVPPPGVQPQPR
ncbi:MAG: hypothetical protein U0168_25375 [Nannocystaceae bacterium]